MFILQHNSNTSYTSLLLLLRDTSREDEVNSDPKSNTEIDSQKKLGESVNSNPMRELIQGRKQAEQLKIHLSSGSSDRDGEYLVNKILSSIDKSLSILIRRGERISQQPNDAASVVNTNNHISKSPVHMDASPATDNFNGSVNSNAIHVNKRKTLPRWADNVRIISDDGLEEALDDGYSWIKYGQKENLGSKYPRDYYRCIHRNTQNCWATKRVKRSDEDPTVFEVSYRRLHTCYDGPQSVPSPALLEKQEQNNISKNDQQQQLRGTLFNFLPSANSPFLDIDLSCPPPELDLSLN